MSVVVNQESVWNQKKVSIDVEPSLPWYQNKAVLTRVGLVALAAISIAAGIAIFNGYLQFNIAEAARVGANVSQVIVFNSIFTLGLYALPFVVGAALATVVPSLCLCEALMVVDLTNPKHAEQVRKQVQTMDIESILNQYSLEEIMRYNLVDKKTFDHKYQEMIQREKQLKSAFEDISNTDRGVILLDPRGFAEKLENARFTMNRYEARRKAVDKSIELQYAQLRRKYPEH